MKGKEFDLSDLAEMIQLKNEGTGKELPVKAVVYEVSKALPDALVQVRRVEIAHFGVFEIQDRKPRVEQQFDVDPVTGKRVRVGAKMGPPRQKVTFRAAADFRHIIEAATGVPTT